ncbi:MAG: peroxiredoxin [Deltaproteobacteria bacterium]|nr:peroxiredoxin [Deltaproteobacteria bacterium]
MRRWEELRPTLSEKGIEIVAISTDSSDNIRKGRSKHGCGATFLADPDLEITDRYNLRNPLNVSPRGLGGLPIPTTFLVDAAGVVRWIDQTDDYMLRSAPDRVLAAIQEQLPS